MHKLIEELIKEQQNRAKRQKRLTGATPNWIFVFLALDTEGNADGKKNGPKLVAICSKSISFHLSCECVWYSRSASLWMAKATESSCDANDESIIIIMIRNAVVFAVRIVHRYIHDTPCTNASVLFIWPICDTHIAHSNLVDLTMAWCMSDHVGNRSAGKTESDGCRSECGREKMRINVNWMVSLTFFYLGYYIKTQYALATLLRRLLLCYYDEN